MVRSSAAIGIIPFSADYHAEFKGETVTEQRYHMLSGRIQLSGRFPVVMDDDPAPSARPVTGEISMSAMNASSSWIVLNVCRKAMNARSQTSQRRGIRSRRSSMSATPSAGSGAVGRSGPRSTRTANWFGPGSERSDELMECRNTILPRCPHVASFVSRGFGSLRRRKFAQSQQMTGRLTRADDVMESCVRLQLETSTTVSTGSAPPRTRSSRTG